MSASCLLRTGACDSPRPMSQAPVAEHQSQSVAQSWEGAKLTSAKGQRLLPSSRTPLTSPSSLARIGWAPQVPSRMCPCFFPKIPDSLEELGVGEGEGVAFGREWHVLITSIGVSGGQDCLSQACNSWQPPVPEPKTTHKEGACKFSPSSARAPDRFNKNTKHQDPSNDLFITSSMGAFDSIPILQMQKLRYEVARGLVQSHKDDEWQSAICTQAVRLWGPCSGPLASPGLKK